MQEWACSTTCYRPSPAQTWRIRAHPVRIVAFNTAEGWSRDVTVDVTD